MEEKIILLCDDSIDGIFTAIFDGFVIRNQRYNDVKKYNDNIEICTASNYTVNMFAEYITIQTDYNKSNKTSMSIRKKMGDGVYSSVINALCNFSEDRGTAVFGFLVRGFKIGKDVLNMLTDKYVMRIMELSRKTGGEAHLFKGFVRFKEIGNTLYSVIEPKCNVVPLIGDHFNDRYPNENWIIYDKKRNIAAIHKEFEEWMLVSNQEFNGEALQKEYERNDEYEQLWKAFYNSIAIKERKNPRCQNNLIPKWYRKNMLEFKK